MSAEVFAAWLRRQGYRVVRTSSSCWVQTGPRLYQAFPYHWLVQPEAAELDELLRKQKGIGLRYSAPFDSGLGKASYHVVCEARGYSLSTLPKKARYDVRKALRQVRVEPIALSRLADEGWQLRVETLQRQGRSGAENRSWWETLCLSADGLPGFEAWGADLTGKLVASLLAFAGDGCCSILYQQSSTEHLSKGVNNALAYVFTSEALGRPGTECVFYGLQSLDAPASVDEFKFRMGYVARPVRQRVVFHPWLRPLFGGISHVILSNLSRWRPDNASLAKAEGMVRFHLQGKRPLPEQSWPEPLRRQRERQSTT